MNTRENIHYTIEAGPSKAMVFDAFKYACDKNTRINLDFSVALAYTSSTYMKMGTKNWCIYALRYEDGSGDRFIIEGSCQADIHRPANEATDYKTYRFKMYYDAQKRGGHVEFLDK